MVAHCHLTAITPYKQEAHHQVGLGETQRPLVRKRCLEKLKDVFDTALDLMQTKLSDGAFSVVFRTSMNADRKQLVMSYLVRF